MSQQRLTLEERIWIGFWHRLGKSGREIGFLVGRCHTDVNRELKRNRGQLGYVAGRAQEYAHRRACFSHARTKLGKDPRLKEWVVGRLREDWSPEQVCGRLAHHPPPGFRRRRLCCETVYQFIYTNEGQTLGLWRHLRRRKPRRRPIRIRHTRPTLITERTSIHDRPEVVKERIELGHWETDTVIGRQASKPSLSVQVERVTRLTRIHRVLNTTADETLAALEKTIDSVPYGLVKTLTFDNGHEGAKHMTLKDRYELQTYFCDPYCSWQKGTVENTNGLIRQYFPKKTDFTPVTNDQIQFAEDQLNSRPRKTLGYDTPNERFQQLTGALAS